MRESKREKNADKEVVALGNNMNLKEQLVVWKKTSYLLKNITMNQRLCEHFVDEDLFTANMIARIQLKSYTVEQTLTMLQLLGSHGERVWEKFLRCLQNTGHKKVVNELVKAQKFTHLGEVLPPSFTYFLDMSEFLKKYPHIAIKLGEDEKHILQSFIDGKIEVSTLKSEEAVRKRNVTISKLKQDVKQLESKLEVSNARVQELESTLSGIKESSDKMAARMGEMDALTLESREEVRKLKHFRVQQSELEGFLAEKAEEVGASVDEISDLGRIERSLSQISLSLQKEGSILKSRQNTKLDLGKRQGSQLNFGSRQNTKMGLGSRQPSKVGRQVTRSKSQFLKINKKHTTPARMRMLQTQINLIANEMYFMLVNIKEYDNEEKTLEKFMQDHSSERTLIEDMKKVMLEVRKERQTVYNQLCQREQDIKKKEIQLEALRKDALGSSKTPGDHKQKHEGLVTMLRGILEWMRNHNSDLMKKQEEKHEKQINDTMQHIQDLNFRHMEEVNKLKGRIRQKIYEIHKRELLLKKIKNQIIVLENYRADNMNATVSVEDCRKIVRGIIGDAIKLKAIAEERELKQDKELTEEEQKKKEEEEKKKEKKKKKKKKKKPEALNDARLAYVGDRITDEWRTLGKLMGLSNNRMDMIEIEHPLAKGPDEVCFHMLKTWREEDKGKPEKLYEALKNMGRDDVAMIVLPMDKVQVEKVQVEDVKIEIEDSNNKAPVPKLPKLTA